MRRPRRARAIAHALPTPRDAAVTRAVRTCVGTLRVLRRIDKQDQRGRESTGILRVRLKSHWNPLLSLTALALAASLASSAAAPERVERTVFLMGTRLDLVVEGATRQAAVEASESALRALA